MSSCNSTAELLFHREIGLKKRYARSSLKNGPTTESLGVWLEDEFFGKASSQYADLPQTTRSTIAAAYSHDGRYLASTHGDHTVKIFDVLTGELKRSLSGHVRTPWVVCFHPRDSNIVASGSLDFKVIVWNINLQCALNEHGFGKAIASLTFDIDGDRLLVAAGHRVHLWAYATDQEPLRILKTRRSLRALQFCPGVNQSYPAVLLTAEVVERRTAPPPAQADASSGTDTANVAQASAVNTGAAPNDSDAPADAHVANDEVMAFAPPAAAALHLMQAGLNIITFERPTSADYPFVAPHGVETWSGGLHGSGEGSSSTSESNLHASPATTASRRLDLSLGLVPIPEGWEATEDTGVVDAPSLPTLPQAGASTGGSGGGSYIPTTLALEDPNWRGNLLIPRSCVSRKAVDDIATFVMLMNDRVLPPDDTDGRSTTEDTDVDVNLEREPFERDAGQLSEDGVAGEGGHGVPTRDGNITSVNLADVNVDMDIANDANVNVQVLPVLSHAVTSNNLVQPSPALHTVEVRSSSAAHSVPCHTPPPFELESSHPYVNVSINNGGEFGNPMGFLGGVPIQMRDVNVGATSSNRDENGRPQGLVGTVTIPRWNTTLLPNGVNGHDVTSITAVNMDTIDALERPGREAVVAVITNEREHEQSATEQPGTISRREHLMAGLRPDCSGGDLGMLGNFSFLSPSISNYDSDSRLSSSSTIPPRQYPTFSWPSISNGKLRTDTHVPSLEPPRADLAGGALGNLSYIGYSEREKIRHALDARVEARRVSGSPLFNRPDRGQAGKRGVLKPPPMYFPSLHLLQPDEVAMEWRGLWSYETLGFFDEKRHQCPQCISRRGIFAGNSCTTAAAGLGSPYPGDGSNDALITSTGELPRLGLLAGTGNRDGGQDLGSRRLRPMKPLDSGEMTCLRSLLEENNTCPSCLEIRRRKGRKFGRRFAIPSVKTVLSRADRPLVVDESAVIEGKRVHHELWRVVMKDEPPPERPGACTMVVGGASCRPTSLMADVEPSSSSGAMQEHPDEARRANNGLSFTHQNKALGFSAAMSTSFRQTLATAMSSSSFSSGVEPASARNVHGAEHRAADLAVLLTQVGWNLLNGSNVSSSGSSATWDCGASAPSSVRLSSQAAAAGAPCLLTSNSHATLDVSGRRDLGVPFIGGIEGRGPGRSAGSEFLNSNYGYGSGYLASHAHLSPNAFNRDGRTLDEGQTEKDYDERQTVSDWPVAISLFDREPYDLQWGWVRRPRRQGQAGSEGDDIETEHSESELTSDSDIEFGCGCEVTVTSGGPGPGFHAAADGGTTTTVGYAAEFSARCGISGSGAGTSASISQGSLDYGMNFNGRAPPLLNGHSTVVVDGGDGRAVTLAVAVPPCEVVRGGETSLQSRGRRRRREVERTAAAALLRQQEREREVRVLAMGPLSPVDDRETPCTVTLRFWLLSPPTAPEEAVSPGGSDDDAAGKVSELSQLPFEIPRVVLCSEMGVDFSPCGRYLACVVARDGPLSSDSSKRSVDSDSNGPEVPFQAGDPALAKDFACRSTAACRRWCGIQVAKQQRKFGQGSFAGVGEQVAPVYSWNEGSISQTSYLSDVGYAMTCAGAPCDATEDYSPTKGGSPPCDSFCSGKAVRYELHVYDVSELTVLHYPDHGAHVEEDSDGDKELTGSQRNNTRLGEGFWNLTTPSAPIPVPIPGPESSATCNLLPAFEENSVPLPVPPSTPTDTSNKANLLSPFLAETGMADLPPPPPPSPAAMPLSPRSGAFSRAIVSDSALLDRGEASRLSRDGEAWESGARTGPARERMSLTGDGNLLFGAGLNYSVTSGNQLISVSGSQQVKPENRQANGEPIPTYFHDFSFYPAAEEEDFSPFLSAARTTMLSGLTASILGSAGTEASALRQHESLSATEVYSGGGLSHKVAVDDHLPLPQHLIQRFAAETLISKAALVGLNADWILLLLRAAGLADGMRPITGVPPAPFSREPLGFVADSGGHADFVNAGGFYGGGDPYASNGGISDTSGVSDGSNGSRFTQAQMNPSTMWLSGLVPPASVTTHPATQSWSVGAQSERALLKVESLNASMGITGEPHLNSAAVLPLSDSAFYAEVKQQAPDSGAAAGISGSKFREGDAQRPKPIGAIEAGLPAGSFDIESRIVCARPLPAAHCLTSVRFSPAGRSLMLAYGRRHVSLCSLVDVDGCLAPVHTALEFYSFPDLELCRAVCDPVDEVNAACFSPALGGGVAYGTKEGRLRIFSRDTDKPRGMSISQIRPLRASKADASARAAKAPGGSHVAEGGLWCGAPCRTAARAPARFWNS